MMSVGKRVLSRFLRASLSKREQKDYYEVAKRILERPGVTIQTWLKVIQRTPGWKREMVSDPADKFALVYDITSPSGKTTQIRPHEQSQEAGFNHWMHGTEMMDQLRDAVELYEQAQQDESERKQQRVNQRHDLGIPYEKAEFNLGNGHKYEHKGNVDGVPVVVHGESYQIDFGMRDEKGRAVGFQVSISEPYEGSKHPDKWVLSFTSTRNGERFSAVRPSRVLDSRRECEKQGRKLMDESYKRYKKQFQGA